MIDRHVLLCALTVACVIAGLFLIPVGRAFPRDLDGRYANSPHREWIQGLRNGAGMGCCDESDGHRVEDVDWRGEPDGTYSVRLDGKWIKLDDYQILKEPNKIGVAMVWVWGDRITCFIAGSGS